MSSGIRGDAPSLRESVPAELEPGAVVAAMRAAKRNGLRRKQSRMVCPASAHPDIGWWAQSNWAEYAVEETQGGPWSVELIAAICGQGWMGVPSEKPERAHLTALGKRLLKAEAMQGSRKDGSSQKDLPAAPGAGG